MEKIELLEKQAESGNVDSIIEIAKLAIDNNYNKEKAIEYLLSINEKMNPEAYYCLYVLYEQKSILDTDNIALETSQKYLYMSAELGFETAYWTIAGESDGEKNYEKAILYIQKLIEKNNGDAMIEMAHYYKDGRGVEQSFEKAFEYYNKALSIGCTGAYVGLGIAYLNGEGVEQNIDEAIKCFEKAIEYNHADAFNNMGFLYYYGEGVEQDYEKAFQYYIKGAEGGFEISQYKVGCMYRDGIGVKQDLGKAFNWLKKATEQYFYKAFNDIGNLYEHGEGTEQNYDLALESFNDAIFWAEANDKILPTAYYNVGRLYFDGKGVEINYKKALEHFNVAIENSHLSTMKETTKEDCIKYKTKIEGLKLAFEEGNISRVALQSKLSIGFPLASEVFDWLKEQKYIDKDGKTILTKEEYEKLFKEI